MTDQLAYVLELDPPPGETGTVNIVQAMLGMRPYVLITLNPAERTDGQEGERLEVVIRSGGGVEPDPVELGAMLESIGQDVARMGPDAIAAQAASGEAVQT